MTDEKQGFHSADALYNEFFLFACKVPIARMVQMNFRFPFLFLALLLIGGCSDDGDKEVVDPAGSPRRVDKPKPVEGGIVREKPGFASNDRKLEEIMEDFAGSIETYPTVDQRETMMKKNGRLYRRGIEDEPFTGTVVEAFPDGSVSLITTFYQGKPHGYQQRSFQDGSIASEIFFDKGILSGTRSKWWKNGHIREEEYWSGGEFKGRRLWDEEGRLIREEIVPPG